MKTKNGVAITDSSDFKKAIQDMLVTAGIRKRNDKTFPLL